MDSVEEWMVGLGRGVKGTVMLRGGWGLVGWDVAKSTVVLRGGWCVYGGMLRV